ncbi:Na+/H+ antiporter NhaC family protein [Abyssicoccus albus]|uniref:Putative methionine transporter (NhaC family) n=1 Tax=Abyssicoccus albus TaxID=1817405 RepID=A0A3N5C8N2_9BACL|nr:Na+/H+ antiporter NhaC family protein [Abyssicoccus albus]RPF54835.1 putative methionine transporter (NhaC family) [Abyssicoccus albus]
MDHNKYTKFSLLPLLFFILIFIGSGIITQDFYQLPINVALIATLVVAMVMFPKIKLSTKIHHAINGARDENIILMVFIFLLAGAFGMITKETGAVESTVNLGLTFIPSQLLLVGVFVIACLISLTMGTSTGTVVALGPIALGIANGTEISLPLSMATVVGGAMFGDNLSFISDTTIVATKTQEVKMIDKFKVNFLIVLPGAVVTCIILFLLSMNIELDQSMDHPFNMINTIPYFIVLIFALIGLNVLVVLTIGIVTAIVTGLITQSIQLNNIGSTLAEGISSMQDIAIIALLIGALLGLIQYYGGINWLLTTIKNKVRTVIGAKFGMGILVSAINIATANNTIALIIAGPLAKDIADTYTIDRRKSASIIDIFASSTQGLLPYGAQILAASGVASISPVMMLQYSYYPMLLLICASCAIIFNYPKLKSSN